jgi:hypothetical protein
MYLTAWDIIKRFLIGWGIGLALLIIYSCVKYWDIIIAAVADNTWAWVNAVMPIVIIIGGILYLIKRVI